MIKMVLLSTAFIMVGCASSQKSKAPTPLSGDELSNLIAQYEQDLKQNNDSTQVNN